MQIRTILKAFRLNTTKGCILNFSNSFWFYTIGSTIKNKMEVGEHLLPSWVRAVEQESDPPNPVSENDMVITPRRASSCHPLKHAHKKHCMGWMLNILFYSVMLYCLITAIYCQRNLIKMSPPQQTYQPLFPNEMNIKRRN